MSKEENKDNEDIDVISLRETYLLQDQIVNRIIIKTDTEGVLETIFDELNDQAKVPLLKI